MPASRPRQSPADPDKRLRSASYSAGPGFETLTAHKENPAQAGFSFLGHVPAAECREDVTQAQGSNVLCDTRSGAQQPPTPGVASQFTASRRTSTDRRRLA